MSFSKPKFQNSKGVQICPECGVVSDPKITKGLCPVCALIDINLLKEMVLNAMKKNELEIVCDESNNSKEDIESNRINISANPKKKNRITKEKLLKYMMKSSENWVSNHIWSMHRMEDGRILGTCDQEDCCWLAYKDFEEMYENYDEDQWRIYET